MSSPPTDDRRGITTRKETEMAPTQTLRVDAYGLLPSLLIVLMLMLAMLGVVAHAAAI
jgi:hypothetical protein